MAITKKPCAYCGTCDHPRDTGHVVQRSLYPQKPDPKIQRPTVPECARCKAIWRDAENHFRNILVIAGDPNDLVMEQWTGPVLRSFDKPSGLRWFRDIVEQMVPVQTPEGTRYAVYPDRDPRVTLVLRKIIRGLCHYHKLGTAIRDERVLVRIMVFDIPPAFQNDIQWHNLGTGFCRYGYFEFGPSDPDYHSAWLVRFYDRCEFVGFVSAHEAGWAA